MERFVNDAQLTRTQPVQVCYNGIEFIDMCRLLVWVEFAMLHPNPLCPISESGVRRGESPTQRNNALPEFGISRAARYGKRI